MNSTWNGLVRFAGVVLCLVALSPGIQRAAAQTAQEAATETPGIAVKNMDTAVKPGDDFYQYANGGWLARTEIPADRASIGIFSRLDEVSSKRTAGIIEKVSKGQSQPGSEERKIADLFNAYMDEAAIESKGLAPLKPRLDEIAAIRDKKMLAFALG